MFPCKETTDIVVTTIASILHTTQIPDTLIPWFVVTIHIVAVFFLIYKLLTAEINNFYYKYLVAWIIILISNYYFHGCILTRTERFLMNDKEWFGPITLLKYIHVPITKDTVNFYIKIIASVVCTTIILKSFHEKKYSLFLFLTLIFTPLLFLKTQSLFEYESIVSV